MSLDILPDSRLKKVFTAKRAKLMRLPGWPEPISCEPTYCANCGKEGPWVPEENTTFDFYLCNACFEKHGAVAGTYAMPDEIFFAKVAEAQLEKHGRFLTEPELIKALEDPFDPLTKLVRDRPTIIQSLRT